jgi:hypothetical protein
LIWPSSSGPAVPCCETIRLAGRHGPANRQQIAGRLERNPVLRIIEQLNFGRCTFPRGLVTRKEGYEEESHTSVRDLLAMATLLENDLPVSYVMEAVKGPLIIKKN